jgi:hypothetical protein
MISIPALPETFSVFHRQLDYDVRRLAHSTVWKRKAKVIIERLGQEFTPGLPEVFRTVN